MTTRRCYCGGTFTVVREQGTRHWLKEQRHDTVICDTCGYVTFDPMLDQAHLNEYYDNLDNDPAKYQYYRVDYGNPHLIEWATRVRDKFFELVPDRKGGTPLRVFDAGCGNGNKVDAFWRVGVEAMGCDLGGKQVAVGLEAGNTHIEVGEIIDVLTREQAKKPFDLVFMFHVLEHMANPEDFLKRLRAVIAPGTMLFTALPSATYIGAYTGPVNRYKWYFFPGHVHLFSPKAYMKLAEQTGWTVNSLEAGHRPDPFVEMTCEALFGSDGADLLDRGALNDFMKKNLISADFWTFLSQDGDTQAKTLDAELEKVGQFKLEFLRRLKASKVGGEPA